MITVRIVFKDGTQRKIELSTYLLVEQKMYSHALVIEFAKEKLTAEQLASVKGYEIEETCQALVTSAIGTALECWATVVTAIAGGEDMGERPEDKTLERNNVDGHYCKDNCTWADQKTQIHNRRHISKDQRS